MSLILSGSIFAQPSPPCPCMILCSFIRKVLVIFRKILQEIVASGDLDVDGGLSWEEFEGFGNFEFVANWFGYEDKPDCPI